LVSDNYRLPAYIGNEYVPVIILCRNGQLFHCSLRRTRTIVQI